MTDLSISYSYHRFLLTPSPLLPVGLSAAAAEAAALIGRLHDRANIEMAQAGLLEPRPLAQM